MTVIVGVETADGVIIGGDSAGISGTFLTNRADPKVFINGSYVIGYTDSFRLGQLLRNADLPKPLDRHDENLDRFMATEFVDGIRELLKAGGYAQKDSEQERGGTFLVGVSGRLYQVESDYQVGWSRDGYMACGCGREIAHGALRATRRMNPETRVRRALEAAAHHSTGVAAPFTILRSP